MSLFAELGLGVGFTMIALAPMVPDWVKHNDGPKISVKAMAGIPDLTEEQQTSEEAKEEAYESRNFGGDTPTFSLFNVNGDRVAYWRNDGSKLTQNSMKEVKANYIGEDNIEKPEYITVTASGVDAVCLMALTVTHPTSSDTYAFLPGEVGKICDEYDKFREDVPWSYSASSVLFKGTDGKTEAARPSCMWIDSKGANGNAYPVKGFQVHLPDFKLDNTTFSVWEDDPFQMCGNKARFGVYDEINEYLCPPVFEEAPVYGARLPLKSSPSCLPGLVPDENDVFETDVCKDDRIDWDRKQQLKRWYDGEMCDNGRVCHMGICARNNEKRSQQRKPHGLKRRNNAHIQKRFTGKLVKSWDTRQTATELCNSESSIGPNFYSYHEKMFCDMKTRTLYPLCETEIDEECFDGQQNETRHSVERRDEKVTHMSVQDWL